MPPKEASRYTEKYAIQEIQKEHYDYTRNNITKCIVAVVVPVKVLRATPSGQFCQVPSVVHRAK